MNTGVDAFPWQSDTLVLHLVQTIPREDNAPLPSPNRTRVRRAEPVAAPLRKQVIELLRDAIASMEFEPGQRLVERDLCERFDVSRTVIREALRHLEAEGLVDLVPNHGPVVSTITGEDARHIYEARETLEGVIARYAAERATPPLKKRMWSALNRLEAAYGRPNLAEQLRAKDELYRLISIGAGNPVLASMLRIIHVRVQVLRGLSLTAPGRQAKSLAELTALVKAIDDGDGDAAARLAIEHVRSAGATALASFDGDGREAVGAVARSER